MDWLDHAVRTAMLWMSLMLDPWVKTVERAGAMAHRHMDDWGVPYAWQSPLLTGLVLVEVLLVVRFLSGWFRGLVLVVTLLTVGRVYGWIG